MLECVACGNQQDKGKFCGKCGGALETVVEATPEVVEEAATPEIVEQEVSAEAIAAEQATTQQAAAQQAAAQQAAAQQAATQEAAAQQAAVPNETLENIKSGAMVYFDYFKQSLKKPSDFFHKGDSEFKNGLINFAVFAVLFSLTFYIITDKVSFYYDVPFFSTFLTMLIFVAVLLGVTALVIFIVNKLFGLNSTFKEILSVYGAHASLSNAIVLVSLLLILINSLGVGSTLLGISLSILVGIIPIYLVASLLTRAKHNVDALYGTYAYLIILVIVYFILFAIFADTMVGNLDMMDMMFPF